jgi:hypothetical protein
MKLERLRGSCNDGKTCPTLYRSDRDTAVVQGWIITEPKTAALAGDLSEGESVVEIPADLVTEALMEGPRSGLTRTNRDTVIVRGRTLTDTEALAELGPIPVTEAVVEIGFDLIAEVARAQ